MELFSLLSVCVSLIETQRSFPGQRDSAKEFNLAWKPELPTSPVSSFSGPQLQRAAGRDVGL